MNNEIVFHINNMTYKIDVDEKLEKDLLKYLDIQENISTKDLLLAYLRMTQEFIRFKNDVQEISDKLPEIYE